MTRTLIRAVALLALCAGLAHGLPPWQTSSPGVRFEDAPEASGLRLTGRQTILRDSRGAAYRLDNTSGLSISCRPTPDDPWRAVIHPPQGGVNARAIAGILDDRLVAVVPTRDAYIWSIRCDEVWADAPEVRVAAQSPRPQFEPSAAWSRLPEALSVRLNDSLFDLDGRACMAADVAIWCYDFDDPDRGLHLAMEAAELGAVADAESLTEDLLSGLWDRLFSGLRDHLNTTWRIRASQGLPDGSAAFVVQRRYIGIGQLNGGTTGPLSVLWVLRRHPDGAWTVRFEGPPAVSSGTTHDFTLLQHMSPIGEGTELYYDSEWHALWVGPVFNWQPSGITDSGAERRQFGLGYRVLPLDAPGSGYLDLTEAWGVATACDERSVGACTVDTSAAGWWLPDNTLYMRLSTVAGDGWDRRLVIDDRDALDLDGDGLSRAAEAALGTSDFDPDHDGDGAYDGVEVTLGDDPARADGGWQPPVSELFIPSPLFAEAYLPGVAAVSDHEGDTLSAALAPLRLSTRGPLCYLTDPMGCGECIDVHQAVVGRWCQGVRVPPQVSWDGTLLVYRTAAGFEVLDFATGDTRPWIDLDALRPLYADLLDGVDRAEHFDVYAIDADTLYVINKWGLFNHLPAGVRVTHVDRSGTPTVIFDLITEACTHGVGTPRCADNPPGWRNVNPFGRSPHDGNGQLALGYHARTGRLMVGVGGSPESEILALHPTEPPISLLRSRPLRTLWRDQYARRFDVDWGNLFPQGFIELADGAFFTDLGLRGPRLERPLPNPYAPVLFPGHGLVFQGVFGDVILDQRGVEWVRAGRAVRPGDTLYLARDTQVAGQAVPGYMLYGIGPRGGANPLWAAPRARLVAVTGMHVAADGRLCIADRYGERLLELGPDADGVPTAPLRDLSGLAPVDCHYDAAGELRVLLADPPRVAVVTADGGLGEATPIDGIGQPAGLIDTPDGGYEVLLLDPADTLRGAAYDADGVRAEFRNGVGVDDLGQPLILTAESAVHAVLRPNGSFVAVMSALGPQAAPEDVTLVQGREPLEARPDGLAYPIAFIYPASPHAALAQVPGGAAVDPWTGAPLPLPPPVPPDGGGVDAGAPGDGGPAAARPADDGGCACAAGRTDGPGPAWLLWIGLWGLRRRRRP